MRYWRCGQTQALNGPFPLEERDVGRQKGGVIIQVDGRSSGGHHVMVTMNTRRWETRRDDVAYKTHRTTTRNQHEMDAPRDDGAYKNISGNEEQRYRQAAGNSGEEDDLFFRGTGCLQQQSPVRSASASTRRGYTRMLILNMSRHHRRLEHQRQRGCQRWRPIHRRNHTQRRRSPSAS